MTDLHFSERRADGARAYYKNNPPNKCKVERTADCVEAAIDVVETTSVMAQIGGVVWKVVSWPFRMLFGLLELLD